MTDEQRMKAHFAIHSASAAAALVGAGLAQIPLSDSVPLSAIQISMILQLGGIFHIRLNQSTASATLGSATSTLIGRSLSSALISWVPFVGNIVNSATASSVTEIIGWAVANDFANRSERSIRSGK